MTQTEKHSCSMRNTRTTSPYQLKIPQEPGQEPASSLLVSEGQELEDHLGDGWGLNLEGTSSIKTIHLHPHVR